MPMPDEKQLDAALSKLGFNQQDVLKCAEQHFKSCDKDGNGKIDESELKSILLDVRKAMMPGGDIPGEKEMAAMVKSAMSDLDKDKSGMLDLSEFSILVKMYLVLGNVDNK
mmetsp:Transcript_7590/g.14853  ORF Transcript_7590/g.14853 Transcript_7590/m.14853 type:complete len:111 (-) Transcript_7590:476-808(-)|eukprot:CAMPEP_0170171482 /NCGR_PEP_ID=MMETSP0040_2-20121228/4632_1 /TAXON_ID=641309 /ORGANISM="Lotharella oceanica, Strain CCMP622" /LENGTH=110 /DNA_ID=CAMNT_0010411559 /DNA_START=56 /DNA_END=388 /DNA_ORIENTATION=-